MESRCFASYYSCRSLAIEPKRWITGQRRNREDSRVPPAQSTLSETPVEEAEFIVLNVAGLCLGRAEYRDLHGCGRSKVRGWSCGPEFMAAYVCGRERGTPFQLIVELCSKSSPFTINNEVGSTVRHAGGQIEAIYGVSTQSPQDKERRPKAIARVHEQPGMALRKSWGTSSCLIALFEPREAWVVVRFATWGATTTGG
jgi:hypothetical protein